MNNNMEKEIFDIYVDDIIPNRFQPRLVFDEKSINELAVSIKQHGIIQPLVVRKIGDKYEIIAGERRYKASQIAGLQKVPAVIMNLDDKESAEVAVIENIQRKDLTALEEAESYKKLLDKGYLTQEQLAARMGKAQATISNKLRLLGLDQEVKNALLNEKISERHARSLLSLKDENDQRSVLNKIITNKLTVKQTDELIKSMTGKDSIETLDFPKAVENNELYVEIPNTITSTESDSNQVESLNNEQITKDEELLNTIPLFSTDDQPFNPISNIDVEKIKESAVDINPVQPLADVNALLGIKPEVLETPKQEPTSDFNIPNNIEEPQRARFIPIFDDEEERQNEYNTPSPVAPTIDNEIEPTLQTPHNLSADSLNDSKTYTDSLVQEFRQNNDASTCGSKIVPGDLRSAIGGVKEITQLLEKNNFRIDVEEFDFEHLYQIIIKINK